ncbi:MAG: ABC transporter substrate-binding protein [Halanaerobiales bacterium]
MRKKRLFVSSLLVLLIVLLTGCGENTTQEAEPEEVTLNLFIAQPRFRDQYEAYLDRFVKKYQEEEGITVNYEMEMPGADQASQILKTRLTTGEDLDVFMIHAINEKEQYYKAGYLEDLSDQPWVDDLYDSAREAVTYDDKVLALPLESLTWGILYNRELFDELGIEPAMNLSEMEENVQAIKDAGKTPFLASYNEAWIPQLFLPLTTGAYANTTYPDFIERMYEDDASYSELSEMFNIIDLVHANANEDGLEIGGSDGSAEFAAGEYGMWVQGSWFSATILEANPDFQLGVAPLPVSNDEEQTMINNSVSTSLSVSSFSKHKKVAKDLVAFFLDPEASSDFFQEVQFNPISEIHKFETYPWIDEAVQYVEEGKSYIDPSIPQAVKDESGKSLQSYYSKIVTQEDVINALDESWRNFNQVNQEN